MPRRPAYKRDELAMLHAISLADREVLCLLASSSEGWTRSRRRPGGPASALVEEEAGRIRLNSLGRQMVPLLLRSRALLSRSRVTTTSGLHIRTPLDEHGLPDFHVDSPRFPLAAALSDRTREAGFQRAAATMERHVALPRQVRLSLLGHDGRHAPGSAMESWAVAMGYFSGRGRPAVTPSLLSRLDVSGQPPHLDRDAWNLLAYAYAVDFLGLDGVRLENETGLRAAMVSPACLFGRDLSILGENGRAVMPDEFLASLCGPIGMHAALLH